MEALADADLVLVVLDASQPPLSGRRRTVEASGGRPAIVVENKCDLIRLTCHSAGTSARRGNAPATVRTSAITGAGIPELRQEILRHVGGDAGAQAEAGFLTNLRHQNLVHESLAGLAAATTAVDNRIPHEMLLLDLYNALRPLDEITGATTTDDILNLIFSTFCIGK